MVILALLCPVPAAGAGLLDSSAQRHGFCGMQPAKTHRPQTRARSACMLCACKDGPTACALLEFTEAPLRILRVSAFVDIGIPIATSLALEKIALCLISQPAAIFSQTSSSSVPAFACQLTAGSLWNDYPLALLHGTASWLNSNHFTCMEEHSIAMLVPGNLPSQLEILPTGRTYCRNIVRALAPCLAATFQMRPQHEYKGVCMSSSLCTARSQHNWRS